MGNPKPALYTLGIDPGVTTGWAVLDQHGEPRCQGTWQPDEVLDGIDQLIRALNRAGLELDIAQEILGRGRDGALATELRFVQRALTRIIEDTYDVHRTFVLPGTWKQHRSALIPPIHVDGWSSLSIHIRDAIRIAYWRISTRGSKFYPRGRFLDLPGKRRGDR